MSEPLNLKKLLAKAFSYPEEEIGDSDSPETIPGWDSFQSLIMFQELEKAAKISFSIDDLKNIKNVADIRKLLEKYKVNYTL